MNNQIYVLLQSRVRRVFMELSNALSGLCPRNFPLKKSSYFSLIKVLWKGFLKKAINFLETETPKKSVNFRKRNFLLLQETKLFIFQEKYIQNPSVFRTLVYSKPWHIQNQKHIQSPGIFRTRCIFRTLTNIYGGKVCKKQLPSALSYILQSKTL